MSRYWDRVQRPEQLMVAMLNAMRVLTDPARTGAVTVCLPQDVQGESYDYPVEFFARRVWHIERAIPSPAAVQRAVALIKNSKRPMIVSGGGTRYSDAGAAVEAFGTAFGVPVSETQAGKARWPEPLPPTWLRRHLRRPVRQPSGQEADLVLVVALSSTISSPTPRPASAPPPKSFPSTSAVWTP